MDTLGISRNTVSKAISNSVGVADATRDRILRKAVEMGYKQFSYAASLPEMTALRFAPASTHYGLEASGEIAVFTANLSLLSNHFAISMLDKFKSEIFVLKTDQQCSPNFPPNTCNYWKIECSYNTGKQ